MKPKQLRLLYQNTLIRQVHKHRHKEKEVDLKVLPGDKPMFVHMPLPDDDDSQTQD